MTPEMRSWLRQQVEVMIRRKPNVTLQEMKVWIHTIGQLLRSNASTLKRKEFFWRKLPLVLAKVRQLKKLGMNKLYT